LASKDIHHATLAWKSFVSAGPQPEATQSKVRLAPASEPVTFPIYADPWMNFSQMTLLTVQRDGADLFKELKSKYESLYSPDSNFVEVKKQKKQKKTY
jgi:hypothetical protein